jgi:uncharacterized protein (DUF305 family)
VSTTDQRQEPETPAGSPSRGASRRLTVIILATVAALSVGVAAGVLITQLTTDEYRPPAAGSVDVGFSQDMQVHHLQAVTMAGVVRDKTADPRVRDLAFDIESTQLGQVGELAGWLTVWEQPELPEPGRGYMGWMTQSAGHTHQGPVLPSGGVAQMPGMASSAELARLKSLSGQELDVLFLQLMVRHHQGAVPMAQYAAEHADRGYVRDLARKIAEGQRTEVGLMTAMLTERTAQPLPAPS